MKIRKPAYFDTFRCIAGACPDSCCKEWDVLVDEDSAAFYRALPGDLGDRLRNLLKEEDGDTVMTIIDRRCPMWRADGLCDIQAALGHDALCKTCRDFPRLTHDYGDFIEYGLELSCPEAARIILTSPAEWVEEEVPGGEAEYDEEAMEVLLRTRDTARTLLAQSQLSVPETLATLLLYGYQAQDELDGGEEMPFDADSALESAALFAKNGDEALMVAFFTLSAKGATAQGSVFRICHLLNFLFSYYLVDKSVALSLFSAHKIITLGVLFYCFEGLSGLLCKELI